jgi:hypothetical protein
MKALLTIAIIASAAMASAAAAQPSRAVRIGISSDEADACGGSGEVSGLNPRGDNFLSVRAAPSARARELGRLRPGQVIRICERAGAWWGIIYGRTEDQDCGLNAVRRPRAYAGPCRSGWVAARYVRPLGE